MVERKWELVHVSSLDITDYKNDRSSEWLLSKEWAVGYYTARWEVLKQIIETHDYTADPRVQETNNLHVYITPMMEALW